MLRAIGPPMSCVLDSGTMPVRLDSPCVPRKPTRLLCDAGMRIDPQVSLPMPAAAKFAATAAPVPPLEPPDCDRDRRDCGLAEPRADGRDAGGELVHVRLAENHRAGVAEPLHLEGVGCRMERRQRD